MRSGCIPAHTRKHGAERGCGQSSSNVCRGHRAGGRGCPYPSRPQYLTPPASAGPWRRTGAARSPHLQLSWSSPRPRPWNTCLTRPRRVERNSHPETGSPSTCSLSTPDRLATPPEDPVRPPEVPVRPSDAAATVPRDSWAWQQSHL